MRLPWFLREAARLESERAGIEALSREASWLVGAEWKLDNDLCLDAIVRVHGYDYEVRVEFPSLFPEAPIVVRPRNAEARLSQHQYGGPDGPLCLEWGPDNWHQSVTASQMLESTQRLLDIENPLGQNRPAQAVVAPSRHQLTIGQDLRRSACRWYASSGLRRFLAERQVADVGSFKLSLRECRTSWTVLLHEMTPLGGDRWTDAEIPASVPEAGAGDRYAGAWFKIDVETGQIGSPSTLSALRELLSTHDIHGLLATDGTSPVEGFHESIAAVLIVDRSAVAHLFVILSNTDAICCSPVSGTDVVSNARAPDSGRLQNTSIGIVGLGSAGSKLALTVARMGVKNFYLVDHDVLLPENLRRHALDWQGVTQHKVDAVAAAILLVDAAAEVEVSRIHLSGQESNAAVNVVLARLGNCDLIVDATANARVFNLLAAVARTAGRPLAWLEVFGGGVGGMIARSRPRVDPSPQDMRQAYLQLCSENPAPDGLREAEDYSQLESGGQVLTASDADVAIIAHHAARLALDSLVPAEEAKYPYSLYLIGLSATWVFDAPFATIPISTSHLPIATPSEVDAAALGEDNVAFLLDLHNKATA